MLLGRIASFLTGFILIFSCGCDSSELRVVNTDGVLASNIAGIAITPTIDKNSLVLNFSQQRLITTPDFVNIDFSRSMLLMNCFPDDLLQATSYYVLNDDTIMLDGTLCVALYIKDNIVAGYYRIKKYQYHVDEVENVLSYSVLEYEYCKLDKYSLLCKPVVYNERTRMVEASLSGDGKFNILLVPAYASCLFGDNNNGISPSFYYVVQIPKMKNTDENE